MPDPITTSILASQAVRAAGQIGGFLLSPRQQRFRNTPAGRRLQRISEEGALSPRQRRLVLSQNAQAQADTAQRRRAATRGQLAQRGLEGSIAGIRALDAPQADIQRSQAQIGERLDIFNEESKIAAGRELAERDTASQAARRAERGQRRAGLVQGLLEGAGQAITARQQLLRQQQVEDRAFGLDQRRVNVLEGQLQQQSSQNLQRMGLDLMRLLQDQGFRNRELTLRENEFRRQGEVTPRDLTDLIGRLSGSLDEDTLNFLMIRAGILNPR